MIVTPNNRPLTFLRSLPSEPPSFAGAYWRGVSHHALATAVLEAGERLGWGLARMTCHLSRDRCNAAMSFDVTALGEIGAVGSKDWATPSLGLLNSTCREHAMQAFFGLRLFSGGGVPLYTMLLGKHTNGGDRSYIKRNGTWRERLALVVGDVHEMRLMVEELKHRQFDAADAFRLCVEAGRNGLMPWSRLALVDKNFQEQEEPTAWSVLAAFAKIAARNPPLRQMRDVFKFKQLVEEIEPCQTINVES